MLFRSKVDRHSDDLYYFKGAYTARTVAAFIVTYHLLDHQDEGTYGSMNPQGEIGVLDRTDMDHFAAIFLAFQKRGKTSDEDGPSPANHVPLYFLTLVV